MNDSSFSQAEALMQEIHKKDELQKGELLEQYDELQGILHEVMKDSGLRGQLESQGVTTVAGFKSTIETFQEHLKQQHCPIVLAGTNSYYLGTL